MFVDIPFREIMSPIISKFAAVLWLLLIALAGWSGVRYGSEWYSPYVALVCAFGFVTLFRYVIGPSWEKSWPAAATGPLFVTLVVGTVVGILQVYGTGANLTIGLLLVALIVEVYIGAMFLFFRKWYPGTIRVTAMQPIRNMWR